MRCTRIICCDTVRRPVLVRDPTVGLYAASKRPEEEVYTGLPWTIQSVLRAQSRCDGVLRRLESPGDRHPAIGSRMSETLQPGWKLFDFLHWCRVTCVHGSHALRSSTAALSRSPLTLYSSQLVLTSKYT